MSTANRATASAPAVFALLVVLLLALCLPAGAAAAPAPASASATKAAPPKEPATQPKKRIRPKPIYWGAWIGDQVTGVNPPFDMTGVHALQGLFGKGLSLIEFS